MNDQKPKKALRGLFSRTEPESTMSAESPFLQRQMPQEIQPSQESSLSAQLDSPTTPVEHKKSETPPSPTMSMLNVESIPQSRPLENPHFELKYNQDLFKSERGQWKENDYITFIHKIDQAQTDAFFLKGKLVSEIKDKFYLDNKKGWTQFCEETLNMNYTTANQYIRVAQEFDVTSHPRKDFGFEHFKALLPLNAIQRDEVLGQAPTHPSVKNLRAIVAQKIQPSSNSCTDEKNSSHVRQVVDTLQKLKIQLGRLKPLLLTQEEKWQLFGAFQNISEDMNSISHTFVTNAENKNESALTN